MSFRKKPSVRVYGPDSPMLKLFNDPVTWKNIFDLPASEEDKPLTAGKIDNYLKIQKNHKEIETVKYQSPAICCHYWEITLLNGQELILKYCTNMDIISLFTKKDSGNDFRYMHELQLVVTRITQGKSANSGLVTIIENNLINYLARLRHEGVISYYETKEKSPCCSTWLLTMPDRQDTVALLRLNWPKADEPKNDKQRNCLHDDTRAEEIGQGCGFGLDCRKCDLLLETSPVWIY